MKVVGLIWVVVVTYRVVWEHFGVASVAGNVFMVSSMTVDETESGSCFVSATVAFAGPANAAESKEWSPVARI